MKKTLIFINKTISQHTATDLLSKRAQRQALRESQGTLKIIKEDRINLRNSKAYELKRTDPT